MNVQPMEVLCTITNADQRLSPQGDASLEVTYDCHLSQYPTRSFCNNQEMLYLADVPKPIVKMLVLIPGKLKNNKPDDGTFYNYWWNIQGEAVEGSGGPVAPWDARDPATVLYEPSKGTPSVVTPPSPAKNSDNTWWSWGQRLQQDDAQSRSRELSIEKQTALKEARLAAEAFIRANESTTDEDEYIATVRRFYEGFVDLLMS